MRVYIRKMMKHDMTHEVSITQYVYYEFFGGKDFVSFQIKESGYMYNVTFNDATDLRFGSEFKAMCRKLEANEGDFLIMHKINDNQYSIDIDKKNISSTRPYMPYFTGFRRHLIATINGLSINKEYIR